MKITDLFTSAGMSRRLEIQGDVPDTKLLYKSFLKMAWPAIVESVLMSLVNLIDTMMVSSCGTNSVAAVGITTQPRMIFYAIFFALSIAVTAIVSRRNGQGDKEGANACLSQSLGLVAILAVVFCGTAVFVAESTCTISPVVIFDVVVLPL
jgi:Na+-driven multidrug efflux pump